MKESIVKEILTDFDNSIIITDLNLVVQGSIVDEVLLDENNELHFYSGDMLNDDNAVELLPNPTELDKILTSIIVDF